MLHSDAPCAPALAGAWLATHKRTLGAHSVAVQDVNDDEKLPGIGTVVAQSHTAHLDSALERHGCRCADPGTTTTKQRRGASRWNHLLEMELEPDTAHIAQ
jgi:hypothetical protein